MRRTVICVAAMALAATTSSCVKSSTTTSYTTDVSTTTVTPTSAPTGPVDRRAVVAADAPACPVLSAAEAADLGGMRLARIQVLRQGTAVVGCRFFAIQGSALAESEHLPGPNQPVIEIAATRYADAVSAHNALARAADKGTDANQYPVAAGVVGVAYRTTFDPTDGPRDWAVGFSKQATLVIVRTARSDNSFSALQVAQAVYPRF